MFVIIITACCDICNEILYSDILFILEVILVVDFIDSRQHENLCLSLTVYYCTV